MDMHDHPYATVDHPLAGDRTSRVPASPGAGGVSLLALTLCLAFSPALAEDPHAAHHAHHHHQHHAMPVAQEGYARSQANYAIPDVKLVDANGAGVPLRSELDEQDKPVLLNFIFTTCGAICPVMSTTFSQVQDALGPEREAVRMVSISIDPEQDTPAALKAYAGKYGAGPQWQMLTGSVGDSIAVQRAFDVYRGDKMSHQPATFLRAGRGQPWVRLDGFASVADILREVRQLRAN